MTTLHYLARRTDEVLDALRRGEIVALDTATEEMPDVFLLYSLPALFSSCSILFLLYSIESGLLDHLVQRFTN